MAIKRRIMDETELAFQSHPAFSEKIKVYNKFPYDERIQYGFLVRNTSALSIRLSPDNFISDLFSHVRLARQTNYPGLAIEWVRENEGNITELTTEDVSSQLGPTQRVFTTSKSIVAGLDETQYADNPGQVKVTIDGVKILPQFVYGESGAVWLERSTSSDAVVKITYYFRKLVPPSIFVVDFIENNKFVVAPVYIIENEILIRSTTGTETTAQLAHGRIDSNTDNIVMGTKDGRRILNLKRDIGYSINNTSGLITFLIPLQKNYRIFADYHYQPVDYINGPFTFKEFQENSSAIPGIIICIGRRAKKGDQQLIVISQFREQQAKIYGGHWEMSIELAAIAKDPMQMEQMTDHIISFLWGKRKNILEWEGIALNSVEPTGETEEIHIDVTGDMYYESSVSINLQSEWQQFVPYLAMLKIKDIVLIPDGRSVFKGPVFGYEKLT